MIWGPSADGLAERVNNIVSTLEKLKKWKGHLYNWYDTRTLEILRPKYVSTVDSGNLMGYLMVLREGMAEYRSKKLPCPAAAAGLHDTVSIMCSEMMNAVNSGKNNGTDNVINVIYEEAGKMPEKLPADGAAESVVGKRACRAGLLDGETGAGNKGSGG